MRFSKAAVETKGAFRKFWFAFSLLAGLGLLGFAFCLPKAEVLRVELVHASRRLTDCQ